MRALRWALRNFAPIALLFIFSNSFAIGRSGCADVDRIAREAQHGFVELKGQYEATFDDYKSKFSLGNLTSCTTF